MSTRLASNIKHWYSGLRNTHLLVIAILLSLPAFLWHLGLIGFIGDEGIRTLVAFEMKISGQYLAPTLNGEYYFNKPPLYNWMILGLSSWFGHFGEWPTRLTTLFSLAFFGICVFLFTKKYTSRTTAMTMLLLLLTSGRILIWDSMLGLIDIFFSAVVYLNFMILYHYGRQGKWKTLFLFSYLLFAMAFMLKGLPAVVFEGISIAAALWFFHALRSKLFSREHLLGITVGVTPLLLYYGLYANMVSLSNVFAILTDQSLQRTAANHSLTDTLKHLFTFPFWQIYHFLPWSLFILVVFIPKVWTKIREDPFVRFNFLLLLVNLPVYWASVQVFPRYLLMFVPLFNLVGYTVWMKFMAEKKIWEKIVHVFFISLSSLLLLTIMGMPFFDKVKLLYGFSYIWPILSLVAAFILIGIWSDRPRMFIWMGLMMLILRIGFDFAVLPVRNMMSTETICRESCRRAAAAHSDKPWYLAGDTYPHEVARCYTSLFTHQIIRRKAGPDWPAGYYMVDPGLYPDFPGQRVDSIILEQKSVLYLMEK